MASAHPRSCSYAAALPPQVENSHVKVIANTEYLLTVGDDPHTCFYRDAAHFTVNEGGVPVHGAKSDPPSQDRIALYHYLTKV